MQLTVLSRANTFRHNAVAGSQVEALDGDGGDQEMTAADEPPPKRRKSGGSTRAPVPEQHRAGPEASPAADSDAHPTAAAPRADMRKGRAGPGAAVREGWRRFAADLTVAERAAAAAEGGFAFAFVEGALVKAVREGHWLLLDEVSSIQTVTNGQLQHISFLRPDRKQLELSKAFDGHMLLSACHDHHDSGPRAWLGLACNHAEMIVCGVQINLAPPEALERLSGLLEAAGGGSLTLAERGDSAAVPRHPGFRLLAAMNPATGESQPSCRRPGVYCPSARRGAKAHFVCDMKTKNAACLPASACTGGQPLPTPPSARPSLPFCRPDM